ncbi:hypothetical protein EVAR_93304_1 [Eumeta japonica]|uniref:Uncharacterized protein n=1 Tax=Eumeta variegata TaxID=151549 RepID=A0A4C1UU03_EUMVA|nr:hypothetical protein EVAR_93304_1 [Eumeta japonica]
MCTLKAITASSGPVKVKPLIKSLIFGKIKKSHSARSELNAGWVTSFTLAEIKNHIISVAACGEALSWCNRMRLLGRFFLTFSKTLGQQMVVYNSALTGFCCSSGVVQREPVLEKNMP